MVLCCEDVLLLALLIKKRRRRVRRFRKHPILMSRLNKGLYYTLFDDLCASGSKFFNYFRMSKSSFDELLVYIEDDITVPDTILNKSIPAKEKLALTLRYFATGTSMTDLHFQYRISQPTISVIVRQVCKAFWERMKQVCFPKMTERFWLDTAAEFYQKTNFPHCVGAIDGKHIRVVKPENSGSLYYNYKNYFSVQLLAICDASYKFIFIDVGAYGKSSDSTVFKNSVFFQKVNDNEMNIPSEQQSFAGMSEPFPFVFVGDEGFGLSTFLLRPYAGKCLNVKKRVFNYRLCRARRNIECSFGILSNKWRIFHRPLNVHLNLCEDIVKVCCLLHNFVRERDGYKIEDTLTVEGLFDPDTSSQQPTKKATKLRDKFADYFVSEQGAVPWQMSRI